MGISLPFMSLSACNFPTAAGKIEALEFSVQARPPSINDLYVCGDPLTFTKQLSKVCIYTVNTYCPLFVIH